MTAPAAQRDAARPGAAARQRGRGPAAAPPSERKFVTLLRADLARSTILVAELELEEGLARLAPALEAMREAVHAFGGVVTKELGDGLFAAFGAPIAEDLHAVMACHAALDLVRRVRALGDAALQVRIGLHSGEVVAGITGTDYARTYDLGGPAMILVERLQAAAPADGVLASEACRGLAEGYIRFGPAQPLDLKGFARPVATHAVEGVAELSKWRVSLARGTAAFVGRAAELERLRDLALAVERSGTGEAVALTGEPGIGKSRLAHEVLQALTAAGWQALEAECSPITGRAPFALLGALLGAAAGAIGAEAVAALRADLPAAQAAALAVVLDGAAAPAAWTALTPRARGRAIAEAATTVMQRAVAGRRTVLLVEDLQWADEASVPAMEAIAALAVQHSVLLLATARTDGLPAWFARRAPAVLALRPLEPASGLAMLDHLLGPATALAPLKRRILEHTGALPLFVEEVCRGLAEAGALRGGWGAFEPAGDAAALGVPPTVQGVIASRIDRLAPPEKRLLQVAAVCGPRVPGRLLRAVAGLKEAVFLAALGALLGAAMLVPAGEAAPEEPVHGFPHELVRQVAYDAVLGPEKAALHAQILAELEARARRGEAGPDLAGALVHHAMMAREWSRAAEYAARIARDCLARSALPDATRYFETAMEAVDRLPESAEREARAVDLRIEARLAYANFGKVQRWLDLAREAEARAQAAGDDRRRVAALTVRAAALNFCGPAVEAADTSQEAVTAASALGDRSLKAYATYGLGQALYHRGAFLEAIASFENAFRDFAVEGVVPPQGGSAQQLALLCVMMVAICRASMGDLELAAEAQCRADGIAAKNGVPYGVVATGLSRGTLLLAGGHHASALQALDTAWAVAEQHDIHLFLGVIGYVQGLAALRSGDSARARELLDRAMMLGQASNHRTVQLRARLYRLACDEEREPMDALVGVEAVIDSARQEGYTPVEIEAWLVKARLLGSAGDLAAQREAASQAARQAVHAHMKQVEKEARALLDRRWPSPISDADA